MTDEELQASLKELGRKPLNPRRLFRVRQRVRERLGRRRPGPGKLIWAALAAALALGWFAIPRPAKLEPPAVAIAPPSPDFALEPTPEASPAREPEITVAAVIPPPPDQPEQGESLLLQIESQNPDVLIYWLVEPKGD